MTHAAGRPGAQPVLALEGLEKRFGAVQALGGVSLCVHAGEILGLVGENGAGKSTLVRIIEGVFPPDAGTMSVDGRPVRLAEPREAHALGIRVIHQEPEIVPALTVAENVFAGAIPRVGPFVDRRRLTAQTRDVIARFGADEIRPGDTAQALGPAQRQMVEIMRAVRAGGRVIAFDEPTSSLTDAEARRLFAVVRSLAAVGTAVIYISHRLDEIAALTARVAVLRDGRLVADGPTAGQTEEGIARAMVGRDIADLFRRDANRPGQPLLEVAGLRTGKVHGVDLTVRAGEVVGIGGLMGAGRSELARGIVGFDRRLGGHVTMAGRAVAPNSPAAAIGAGIGLAPEDRKHEALLLARSVLDNAALAVPRKVSAAGFFSRRRAEAVVGPLTRRLAVKTPSLDETVARLSGGNQQKVVLARWLAVEPMVLILDEPTRGIDVGAKAEIYRLVDDLAKAGIGVLVISSEMPELIGLSDRILVMSGGRVTGELRGPRMTEANILELAMPAHARGKLEQETAA